MDTEPLSTTRGILEATTKDPNLRFDTNLIKKYVNLGGTLSNNVIPQLENVSQPVSVLSSENASKKIPQMQDNLKSMASVQTSNKTNEPQKKDTSLTLINPQTGQERVFYDADINKSQIQTLFNSGWTNSKGYIPSDIKLPEVNDTGVKTVDRTEIDNAKAKIMNFDVSADPMLKKILDITASEWDSRISSLEKLNKSREALINQIGVRLGTQRYAPLTATGILSTEEKDSLDKITDYQNKKQKALIEAENAYKNQKWSEYVKQYEIAKTAYDDERKSVEELNKKVLEENKKLNYQDILNSSVTKNNITDIQSLIKEVGNKVPLETVKDFWELYGQPFVDSKKNIDSIFADARKNGAPEDVLNAINSSKNISEAITSSKGWATTASGIAGEYLFYKRDAESKGIIPVSFDEYQTKDVNRKISVAKASIDGSMLNTQQQAVFNKIVDKYNASPAIKALDRANQLKNILLDAEKNPSNAGSQLNLLYSYIKGLDTDSAVREGELDLVKSISNYVSKYAMSFNKISNNQAVPSSVLTDMITGGKKLVESIEETANRKRKVFEAQAKTNGAQVYSAWKMFDNEINSMGSISDELNKNVPQDNISQVIEYPKGSGQKYNVDANGNMTPI